MYSFKLLHEWLTICEAVEILNHCLGLNIIENHIYRYALEGKLRLSIYFFRSPLLLKQVQLQCGKVIEKELSHANLVDRICMVNTEKYRYAQKKAVIASTLDDVIYSTELIWDIPMIGSEQIAVQELLARSLEITSPFKGQYLDYFGALVINPQGELWLLHEEQTLQSRIASQLKRIANINPCCLSRLKQKIAAIYQKTAPEIWQQHCYFPLYELRKDTICIIRKVHLETFIARYSSPSEKKVVPPDKTERISAPLARLLWLACHNNPNIGAKLLSQPYKLHSLFEVWNEEAGFTDPLDAVTLKRVLGRGKPNL